MGSLFVAVIMGIAAVFQLRCGNKGAFAGCAAASAFQLGVAAVKLGVL